MKKISTKLLLLFALIYLPIFSYGQTPCENYDQSMSKVDTQLQKYPVDYNKLLNQLEQIKENCPEKAAELDSKIQEVTAMKEVKIAKAKMAKQQREAAIMAKKKALQEQPKQREQAINFNKNLSGSQGKYDQPAPRVSTTGIYDNFPGYVGFYTIGLDERKFQAPKAMQSFPEESGIIDIDICIDKSGTVVSAKVNTVNTNISTKAWHEKVIAHAKKFKFDAADGPNQCGSVRYIFKKI